MKCNRLEEVRENINRIDEEGFMKNNEYKNIAVLIDAENISHGYLQQIFENVAAYGKISVRRIYADWTKSNMDTWKQLIHEFSLVTIQQFSNIDSKNVSDFALVIDAMDFLHEDTVDCFCIVSSDSDFTRLAQRIKEGGKTVIGLGEIKTPKAFINACNEFIHLDEVNLITEDTIDTLMSKAVDNLSDQEGWAAMSKIMPYIKRIKPAFELKNHNINGMPIKQLGNYFKNNKNEYELGEKNTMVRKL